MNALKTIWVLPIFIIGASLLMIVNVISLNEIDPKFEPNLETVFGFYLPIWLAFYSPHIVLGWLLLSVGLPPSKIKNITLLVFTASILVIFEISYILNAEVIHLFGVFVIALVVALLVRRKLLRHKA